MFEIGQCVILKATGVYTIVAMEEKDFGYGAMKYLSLKPYFSNDNSTLVFIREDKAESQLRFPINKDEALLLIDSIPTLEKVWYTDSKVRRQKIEECLHGDLKRLCQLVKSLYLQNEELKTIKKTLSILDRDFLNLSKTLIYQEFAIALETTPSEIEKIVVSKIIN